MKLQQNLSMLTYDWRDQDDQHVEVLNTKKAELSEV